MLLDRGSDHSEKAGVTALRQALDVARPLAQMIGEIGRSAEANALRMPDAFAH
jgi:hypothetical protein